MRTFIVVGMLLGLAGHAKAAGLSEVLCAPYEAAWSQVSGETDISKLEAVERKIPAQCAVRAGALRRIEALKSEAGPRANGPSIILAPFKPSLADRSRAAAAGCLPGARVAAIHDTTGCIKWRPEQQEECYLQSKGLPLIVDRDRPLDADRCRVSHEGDDPKDPTPPEAVPLVDLRPFDEAQAFIAARRP